VSAQDTLGDECSVSDCHVAVASDLLARGVSHVVSRALQARWKAKCDWLKCIGGAIAKGVVAVVAAMASYHGGPVIIEHRWSTMAAFITTFLHSNSVHSGVSMSGVKRRDIVWLICAVLCMTTVSAQDPDDGASSGGGSGMAEALCAAAGAVAGALVSGTSKKRRGTKETVSP